MPDNSIILLLGSNIDPAANIQKALDMLDTSLIVIRKSRLWKTEAIGSSGPDFLNMAVEVQTKLNADQVKKKIINLIEHKLQRVRTIDKYAPRTIDIDVITINRIVLDTNIWERLFIALPVSEILPYLINPTSGESLIEVVKKLKSSAFAELLKIV